MYTVVFMGKEGFIFLPWLLRDCRLRHCLQRLEIANSADARCPNFISRPPSLRLPRRSPFLPHPSSPTSITPSPPPSFRLVRNESRFSLASLPSINLSWLPAERAGLHPKCEKEREALASFTRCGRRDAAVSVRHAPARTYNMHGKRRAHKKNRCGMLASLLSLLSRYVYRIGLQPEGFFCPTPLWLSSLTFCFGCLWHKRPAQ